MANFIGESVFVTLTTPPGLRLKGIVHHFVQGDSLTLRDVIILHDGARFYEQKFHISQIEDIKLERDTIGPAQPHGHAQMGAPQYAPAPPQAYGQPYGNVQMGAAQHAPVPGPQQFAPPTHAPAGQGYGQPHGHGQMGEAQHAPIPTPAKFAPAMHAPAPTPPTVPKPMFEDPAILSMSRKGTGSGPPSNMNSRQNSNQGSYNNTAGTTPAPRGGDNKGIHSHSDQRGGHLQNIHNQSDQHSIQERRRSLAPGIIPVSLIPEATMLPARVDLPRRTTATKKTDRDERKITPAAILVDPMERLRVNVNDDTEQTDSPMPETMENKRKRNQNRRNNQRNRSGRQNNTGGTDALQTNPAEGWRKTPLLRPNASFQPFDLVPGGLAKARATNDNGWETGDATDVQDMPEFDFESSNRLFDKRGDFKKFKEQDMTADEDTCVGMNRLNTPSKNFGNTENVLDSRESRRESFKGRRESMNRAINGNASRAQGIESPAWNSEGSESDDENEALANGRHSRARGHTGNTGSGAGSHRSRRGESILRTSIGPGGKRPESSHLRESINNSQPRQPRKRTNVPAGPRSRSQAKAAAGQFGTISRNKGEFYLVPADRRVDTLSALEMLTLETVANELSLTDEIITEHAARGIAEVAMKAMDHGKGHKRVSRSPELSIKPHVVIFAGNNKSGARAIATGRLLRHHGVDVIVCVVGLDRETELLEGVRRQLKLFRTFGGKGMLGGAVTNKDGLFEYLNREDISVQLIIDGLLGLTMSFKELVHRPGELTEVTELIKFGNRSSALVLAIDVPSGLNPITGGPMVVREEEEGGWMDPDLVVCLGVPKTGLVAAMREGMGSENDDGEGKGWKLSLVDVGIGRVVWKKAKMKSKRPVEFEGNWVLGMRFQQGSD